MGELERRGIYEDDLVSAILELHVPHPGVETKVKAEAATRAELKQTMSDVNVSALVMAGLRLEEDGKGGLIPGLPKDDFVKDPRGFVADEVLGLAIANYIGGTKGVFEYIRFDQAKPGVLKKLGPVTDDVIGGLLGGVSANMYTNTAGRR